MLLEEIKAHVMSDLRELGLTISQAKVVYSAIKAGQISYVSVLEAEDEDKENKDV